MWHRGAHGCRPRSPRCPPNPGGLRLAPRRAGLRRAARAPPGLRPSTGVDSGGGRVGEGVEPDPVLLTTSRRAVRRVPPPVPQSTRPDPREARAVLLSVQAHPLLGRSALAARSGHARGEREADEPALEVALAPTGNGELVAHRIPETAALPAHAGPL